MSGFPSTMKARYFVLRCRHQSASASMSGMPLPSGITHTPPPMFHSGSASAIGFGSGIRSWPSWTTRQLCI